MFRTNKPRRKRVVLAFFAVDAAVTATLLLTGHETGLLDRLAHPTPASPAADTTADDAPPIRMAPTATKHAEQILDRLAVGECWQSGSGHPYPTSVWVPVHTPKGLDYRERGQAKVDWFLSDFSRVSSDTVTAFCE